MTGKVRPVKPFKRLGFGWEEIGIYALFFFSTWNFLVYAFSLNDVYIVVVRRGNSFEWWEVFWHQSMVDYWTWESMAFLFHP